MLGFLYQFPDKREERDYVEAAKWYERAASQGQKRAEDQLYFVKRIMARPQTTDASGTLEKRTERVDTPEESIERIMNKDRQPQTWFKDLHPIGTAKNIKVHEVKLQTKDGTTTGITIRFTLYWQGPITTDGWTKVKTFYDCETERYTQVEIEATNGKTNSDIGKFLKDFAVGFGAGLLNGMLQNQTGPTQ